MSQYTGTTENIFVVNAQRSLLIRRLRQRRLFPIELWYVQSWLSFQNRLTKKKEEAETSDHA